MGSLFHHDNQDMAVKKEINTLQDYFFGITQQTKKYLSYFLKAHNYDPTYLIKPYDRYWDGIGLMYDALYDLQDDARLTNKLSHFLRSFSSMFFHSKVHIIQAQVDLIEATIVLLYQLQWMLRHVLIDLYSLERNQSELTTTELLSYCNAFKNSIPNVLKEIKEAEDILELRGYNHFFKFFKAHKHARDIDHEEEVKLNPPQNPKPVSVF